MMVLKEYEVCPLQNNCPYNKQGECFGASSNRPTSFVCEYVVDGKILEGGQRLPGDKTGKMKLLID